MTFSVNQALDQSALQQIFRLRYQVYCHDGRRDRPGVDHTRQSFTEALDDEAAVQLYVDDAQRIAGVLRLNVLAKSSLSSEVSEWLGTEQLLSEWAPGDFAYASRLMVAPEYRKTRVGMLLICAAHQRMIVAGVRFGLMYCRPDLVPLYEHFGFVPYRDAFEHPISGINVPLVWALAYRAHLQAVNSPVIRLDIELRDDPEAGAWIERNRRTREESILATESK